jgi:hypothetical protein
VFEDAPPGGYRFAISVSTYPGPNPASINAVLGMAQDEWALVGQSGISLPTFVAGEQTPAMPIDAVLGEQIRLLGATFDTPLDALQPGETLNVQLFWEAVNPIAESYTLFLHVKDAEGNLVAQQDVLPFDGQYPTWAWRVGETVITPHRLTVPNGSISPYTLSVGMYRYPSLERLAVVWDGEPVPDHVVIISAGVNAIIE